jgi:hypothetical protein
LQSTKKNNTPSKTSGLNGSGNEKIKPLKTYMPVSKELYDIIFQKDNAMFNAFNARELEKLKTILGKDLEVFQDNTVVRNYQQTIEAFTDLFNKDYVLKRELLKGSMEVYPIKDYGAIQTGKHMFCHTENGKLDCGTFKFVQTWQKKNGEWKVTRIITYDH